MQYVLTLLHAIQYWYDALRVSIRV